MIANGRLKTAARYLTAPVFVVIAFLLVIGFWNQLQPHDYALFLFAVVATALVAGLGAALVAIVLALAAMNYADFLTHSAHLDLNDFVELGVFVAMALTVTLLTAARQKAERDLAEANDNLRELDRAKDRFIASVSHELKSPVTAILGWVSLARDNPDLRQTALDSIEQSARAQARLTEDLLDMSRLILGKLQLHIAPVALLPIVQQSLQIIRPAAEAKGIAIQLDLPPNPCLVDGDAMRLQQICSNLLSNAVKFTPDGGRVSVGLACDGTTARLIVTDTGEGIARDLLPHVFETLTQGGGAAAKGGLGLGLSIVRQLVTLHHGTVSVHSDGQGKGARFEVRLPLIA